MRFVVNWVADLVQSLDLHQTARAHLYSSLVKVKSIAASTDLPDEVRSGVAKPELEEEEKAALHNVTSGLYKRDPVRQAVTRAVTDVCDILGVPTPEKAKRLRKGKQEKEEERVEVKKVVKKAVKVEEEPVEVDYEEEFHGFESDVDEPGPSIGDADSEAEAVEEKAFSKYDHLLGSSSESESDSEDEDDGRFERFKGRERVNLDDISLSGSAPSSEAGSDSESEPEEPPTRLSLSPSPPPAKKKKSAKTATRPGDSTFLPTLMGGYISGSESASSIDVAPPKKRLGQKQRQAIWEKKFGAKAKHLQNQPPRRPGARDSGWDMRRGAVDGDDQDGKTPWKKGIRNPLTNKGFEGGERLPVRPERKQEERKKDDQGALHPSWEARKKAKESQKTASFAGSKITFD